MGVNQGDSPKPIEKNHPTNCNTCTPPPQFATMPLCLRPIQKQTLGKFHQYQGGDIASDAWLREVTNVHRPNKQRRYNWVIRNAWDDTIGQPATSEHQWAQCLPLRMTGLGMKDPTVLHQHGCQAFCVCTETVPIAAVPTEILKRPDPGVY